MRFVVFGSRVASSLSPAMHMAALLHHGIDGDYEAWTVDDDGLRAGIRLLRTGVLSGANVTMPLKGVAHDACDQVRGEAARAGAVNTLSVEGGDLVGRNTDIDGIRSAWVAANLPEAGPVTLLGAGGAAAAALLALEGRAIRVVARDEAKAQDLIDRTGVGAEIGSWDDRPRGSVVVNATPVGMMGETISPHLLVNATGLFDMAYSDTPTPAVGVMRESGLPVAEGLDMLVAQAALSFEIWTAVRPEQAVMRAAARSELSNRNEQKGL